MKRLTPISLYLDDQRANPYLGWRTARTAEEALGLFLTREIEHASLDHDLGACDECNSLLRECETLNERVNRAKRLLDEADAADVRRVGELRIEHEKLLARLVDLDQLAGNVVTCPHATTGYDLLEWLAHFGVWPTKSIRVHSANPEGAQRMRAFIAQHWPGPNAPRPKEPHPGNVAAREARGAWPTEGTCPKCGVAGEVVDYVIGLWSCGCAEGGGTR